MTVLASNLTGVSYTDTSATADQVYYYAVRAVDGSGGGSALSNVDDGKKGSSTGSTDPQTTYYTDNSVVVVPAGRTKMEVWLVGGGGNGGRGIQGFIFPSPPDPYGGGGASGAMFHLRDITGAARDSPKIVGGKRAV